MISTDPVFLNRVVLSNYRSIRECDVRLGPLTFLVGPNGAGKSNFLDALRLVADSLNISIEHALRDRGGINEVRHRSSGHPTHFGIRLEWRLPDGLQGVYAFRVGALPKGGFEIQQERARIFDNALSPEDGYCVEKGEVKEASFKVGPPASSDRLYLVAAAGLPAFRPLYDALSHMGFYNLYPEAIRELQPPDPGAMLKRDGSNLASVLAVMSRTNPSAHSMVVEFLGKVVPGIRDVNTKQVGRMETLEFRQIVGANENPWRFGPENMSDGTLRALGVLTALFQPGDASSYQAPFIGIEEPEAAVHPGAAGVLRDALSVASHKVQVAVTSHSPDLLDDKEIAETSVLAVYSRNGESRIGPPDEAGRRAIRDRLHTAGELLRLNQLEPESTGAGLEGHSTLDLFEDYRP